MRLELGCHAPCIEVGQECDWRSRPLFATLRPEWAIGGHWYLSGSELPIISPLPSPVSDGYRALLRAH
jgi:hypothetical protein